MKYCIVTFGCRVNQADSLGFEEELRAGGGVAADARDADLVVVNTCSVTASADQGARQTIRRVARDNPGARIVVTGCYATRRSSELAALPRVVQVTPNDSKPQLVRLAMRGFAGDRPGDGDGWTSTAQRFAGGDGPCGAPLEPGAAGRTAFTLRVQTGCGEACSYCIIPSTRGVPRSLPPADVLGQVRRVVAAGYKEIALTGVHLGSYGRDLAPRGALVALLRAISSAEFSDANVLFRVSSLEPMDCPDELVDLVATSTAFAPHFHLPLQHASDRLLAAMRRPYTIDRYASLVDTIRRRLPHASIGTDVIVGFPGERDDDFEGLAAYLAGSPLTHVHVFPYSDRPGTDASAMSGKVAGAVVRERGRRVREIAAALGRRFRTSQVGRVRRALTLEDGSLVVTDNYLKLRIPAGRSRNEWVRVRVLSHDHGELLGGGSTLAFDDELAARGADVAAAALADRHDQPALGEDRGEAIDRLV
jgi:threonylcarbamoyladenosine tRNA methylthiotransferase MtaB